MPAANLTLSGGAEYSLSMEVGAQVGAYKIVRKIGEGGMGAVWLAEHGILGRHAAIKLLHASFSANQQVIRRFFNEARAATTIPDPGIVQIYDFGHHSDGTAYIAMEFLDGEALERRLRRLGKLAIADALRIMRQVASTVGVAHSHGIVHRDLKPGNVFLVRDPEVPGGERAKVLDFGIAKLNDELASAKTMAGTIMGTPNYMSPEQARGLSVDPRSDVYALGCVLFELIAGAPPFPAASPINMLAMHANDPAPALSSRAPEVSPEIDALVARCLAKDPDQRYASGAELAAALGGLVGYPNPASPSTLQVTGSAISSGPSTMLTTGSPISSSTSTQVTVPPVTVPPVGPSSQPQPKAFFHVRPPTVGTLPGIELGQGGPATERDGMAAVFDAVVPAGFRDSLDDLVEFFGELFATAAQIGGGAVRLAGPAIEELESREHFVLFLDAIDGSTAAPMAELSTMMFRAQVDPLAEQLAELDTPPGSVLIAVLTALQLGQGARETIFALRRDRKLFVVPIAASEIRRACEDGEVRPLLLDRIADLHTISDPFAVVANVTDPTRCIGFAAEVADLVKLITAGGRIVSVAGPPGSGKTSLIAMAEYGCDTSNVARRFVRLACSELIDRDPAAVIQELHERVHRPAPDGARGVRGSTPPPVEPAGIHATIMQLGTWPAGNEPGAPPPLPLAGPGPAPSPGKRHQLVIVLEDADWMIRLASSAEPDAARRDRARELWRGLAQLCSSGRHTVIVTSIRDFQDQLPFERPVSVARVPMRSLNRRDSDRVVTSLGELVGFSPTRGALAALYRESGGNVYALRLLCSSIILATRERADYAPLARLVVTRGMVRDARRDVAATGTTFRSHVAIWLDDTEKVVLQHIARERPRSPRAIWRALEGSADPAQIEKALDSLEHMGLVGSRRGRHRVRVPVFERWINTHLDAPLLRRRAIRQDRMSWIGIGCTVTALLFGAYWAWLRSTRSIAAASIDDCTFQLDSPDRVGTEDAIELYVYQDCKMPRRHDLALEPVLSALSIPAPATDCAATSTSCTASFKATVGKQAHDVYQVRLRVDGQALATASIQKDGFATVRAIGEKTVPTVAFLPLLLSVVIAFHKDLRRQLAALLGRGEPPAAPPAEPSSS
jgi:serine/threonine protein kinase